MSIGSLGKSGTCFNNWSKTYYYTPELYFEPKTTEEIKQILCYASEKGKKVKTVGCGHSFSDLACTTDFMISMARYNRVLKIDKEKLQVTVQGGCLIKDLNEVILPENGMAFSTQGTVSSLTAAGVISTGTHGSGANFSNISASVVDLELMLSSGEIIKVSNTENAELLPVVSLSLGSVGVILSITFQCERAFNLHWKQYPDTLGNLHQQVSLIHQHQLQVPLVNQSHAQVPLAHKLHLKSY
ncbi:hypothetical protein RRG08_047485 [Elysia crispata]|uniref:L-gulonolactone oxidase n=1 Tax=Elysia crispata TaxID=231223 RepID=A0AAE0XZP0_9GAST|nr:hypothetical protein RRG08_047485 [Elysia crispata]